MWIMVILMNLANKVGCEKFLVQYIFLYYVSIT